MTAEEKAAFYEGVLISLFNASTTTTCATHEVIKGALLHTGARK